MTTGAHPQQGEGTGRITLRPEDRAEIHALTQSVTELKTTIRIAGGIIGLVFTMTAGGAVWTMSTALTTQERVQALSDRLDRHVQSEGHPLTVGALAEVRADQRATDGGVRAELAGINRRLDDLQRALEERTRR